MNELEQLKNILKKLKNAANENKEVILEETFDNVEEAEKMLKKLKEEGYLEYSYTTPASFMTRSRIQKPEQDKRKSIRVKKIAIKSLVLIEQ